jgi:hypothetical protein
LVDKKATHEKEVSNFNLEKEKHGLELLSFKRQLEEMDNREQNLNKKSKNIQEEKSKLLEEEKKIKNFRDAVNDTQEKAKLDIEKNNKILQDIEIKKEEIEVMTKRNEALVPVYNELKKYLIEHSQDGTAEQFMTLENIMFKKIQEKKDDYFKELNKKEEEENKEEEKKEEEKKEEEKVDD